MAAVGQQQQTNPSSRRAPTTQFAPKSGRKPGRSADDISVDPRECRVWPGNQRAAYHLNELSCEDLIDSFRTSGLQHTPAFARLRKANDGTCYEIIAGRRRLWAASWVREHHRPDFELRVKLLDITDEEASWLTDSENRDRDDVSDYERALFYVGVMKSGYYESQRDMANRYNMDEKRLSEYFLLAEIPSQIVNAFAKWSDLKIYHSSRLQKLLNALPSSDRVIKRATLLHLEQEERRLAGRPLMSGAQVYRALLEAGRKSAGGGRGPICEFKYDDRTHLRIKACTPNGITMVVPQGNGASIDEMVRSFRACLKQYYKQ